MQRGEARDSFARLRRDLRGLAGRRQPGDEIELAPARDLDHAREVGLAQLDRRARERAHDGRRILRIDEQAHPREHVAHLRAAQERHVARRAAADRLGGRLGRGARGGHHPRIRACGETRQCAAQMSVPTLVCRFATERARWYLRGRC